MNIRDAVKKIVPSSAFHAIEPYGHWAEAFIAQVKYGFPAKGMKVIGVTGTDGKTTTSTLIAHMLREAGLKVALVTTISVDYGDGKGEQPNPTRMTTMGAASLVKLLTQIKANNVDWLVLETTSHALAQHRVWGIPYSVAVMTNVGHEHLDYHRTFERYRDAKRRLFKQTRANKKGLGIGIANADDLSGNLFAGDVTHPISYGIQAGELRANNVQSTPSKNIYSTSYKDQTYNIICNLPGSFNIYNSLATVGVGIATGLSKEQIEQGIASLQSVEGRMTRIDEGQNFEVIVDYAHTAESFEKLFKELRPITKGRLIAVFGSAGRRDEAKRAEQGRVAGKYCNIVIATEEDDRDIDGLEILQQIASGAIESGKIKDKDLLLIHKREDAVQQAITMAQTGDVILLLGKGHEKSILTNGPKAAEHRNELQNDNDASRVIKRDYDEVKVARVAIRTKQT
jgi:UDP-N-acetylmuramoyl-L-alanyl-D-glutamate--2,6-diaminopimelate ligase